MTERSAAYRRCFTQVRRVRRRHAVRHVVIQIHGIVAAIVARLGRHRRNDLQRAAMVTIVIRSNQYAVDCANYAVEGDAAIRAATEWITRRRTGGAAIKVYKLPQRSAGVRINNQRGVETAATGADVHASCVGRRDSEPHSMTE